MEGNPIRCAELLGIAEWATPCRDIDVATTIAPTIYDVDYRVNHQHSCGQQQRKAKNKKKINRICPKYHMATGQTNTTATKGKKALEKRKKLPLKSSPANHIFEEHFDDRAASPPVSNCSVSAEKLIADNGSTNHSPGHPGLFMVIGVTIGMIAAFGLVHLYRSPTLWRRRARFEANNFAPQQEILHMDQLQLS